MTYYIIPFCSQNTLKHPRNPFCTAHMSVALPSIFTRYYGVIPQKEHHLPPLLDILTWAATKNQALLSIELQGSLFHGLWNNLFINWVGFHPLYYPKQPKAFFHCSGASNTSPWNTSLKTNKQSQPVVQFVAKHLETTIFLAVRPKILWWYPAL